MKSKRRRNGKNERKRRRGGGKRGGIGRSLNHPAVRFLCFTSVGRTGEAHRLAFN